MSLFVLSLLASPSSYIYFFRQYENFRDFCKHYVCIFFLFVIYLVSHVTKKRTCECHSALETLNKMCSSKIYQLYSCYLSMQPTSVMFFCISSTRSPLNQITIPLLCIGPFQLLNWGILPVFIVKFLAFFYTFKQYRP